MIHNYFVKRPWNRSLICLVHREEIEQRNASTSLKEGTDSLYVQRRKRPRKPRNLNQPVYLPSRANFEANVQSRVLSSPKFQPTTSTDRWRLSRELRTPTHIHIHYSHISHVHSLPGPGAFTSHRLSRRGEERSESGYKRAEWIAATQGAARRMRRMNWQGRVGTSWRWRRDADIRVHYRDARSQPRSTSIPSFPRVHRQGTLFSFIASSLRFYLYRARAHTHTHVHCCCSSRVQRKDISYLFCIGVCVCVHG